MEAIICVSSVEEVPVIGSQSPVVGSFIVCIMLEPWLADWLREIGREFFFRGRGTGFLWGFAGFLSGNELVESGVLMVSLW
jgi:hypothetical protein